MRLAAMTRRFNKLLHTDTTGVSPILRAVMCGPIVSAGALPYAVTASSPKNDARKISAERSQGSEPYLIIFQPRDRSQ
jgi:hypothetical protein